MWCCCNLRHSADALEQSRLLIAHKADVAWMHCCGVLFCCGDWWHNVKRMKGPVWTSKCYRCFFSASVRFSFPDFAYLTHRKSTTFHQCRWTVQQSPPWSSIWSSAFNIRIIRHTKILVTLEHIAHISLWIYTDLQTSTYPCILQSTYQSINIWVSTNDCTASLGVFGTQSWNTFLHEDATITLTRCLSLCIRSIWEYLTSGNTTSAKKTWISSFWETYQSDGESSGAPSKQLSNLEALHVLASACSSFWIRIVCMVCT